jgi:hypothetical protein
MPRGGTSKDKSIVLVFVLEFLGSIADVEDGDEDDFKGGIDARTTSKDSLEVSGDGRKRCR